MSIVIPERYPLVIATATGTVALNIYQYLNVRSHRKASGIKYPQLYAEKAEVDKNPLALKYNCAQRAHQNTLENLTHVIMMSFISGLKFPIVTSGLLGAWILGRYLWTVEYSTGDPNNRTGIIHKSGIFGLMFTSVATSAILLYDMYNGVEHVWGWK